VCLVCGAEVKSVESTRPTRNGAGVAREAGGGIVASTACKETHAPPTTSPPTLRRLPNSRRPFPPRLQTSIPETMMAEAQEAGAEVGLLISILHSAAPSVWSNVEHTMQSVRPRWSSLAIDMWSRPANASLVDVRAAVLAAHQRVLSLFSRVLFLSTAPRSHVPSHVRPSFSYRLHWHAAFSDYASRWPWGAHAEGLPTLLAGVDADVYVPDGLPLRRLAAVLSGGVLATESVLAETEARARQVWLHGRRPNCTSAASRLASPARAARPPVTPASRRHARQSPSARALSERTPLPSLCEVVTAEHAPLWASPRDLSELATERRRSYGELGMYFYPLGLGVRAAMGAPSRAPAEQQRAASTRIRSRAYELSCVRLHLRRTAVAGRTWLRRGSCKRRAAPRWRRSRAARIARRRPSSYCTAAISTASSPASGCGRRRGMRARSPATPRG
jgi:hypothetical protein